MTSSRIWQKAKQMWLGLRLRRSCRRAGRAFRILAGVPSVEDKLHTARIAVTNLRKGSRGDNVKHKIEWINEALEAGWSYKDVGTTREELIEFRNGKSQQILAKRILEEIRAGMQEGFPTKGDFYELEQLLKEKVFSPEEVGTSTEELFNLFRKRTISYSKRTLEELRKMASDNLEEARGELRRHEDVDFTARTIREGYSDDYLKYHITLADIGTNHEELPILIRRAYLNAARLGLEDIQKAADRGCLPSPEERRGEDATHIDKLKLILEKAKAILEDVGSSENELQKLLVSSSKQLARNTLARLKNPVENEWFMFGLIVFHLEGPRWVINRPKDLIIIMRKALKKANASLLDIGTNEGEVQELIKRGHLFVARLVLDKMRLASQDKTNLLDDERFPFDCALEVVRGSLKQAGCGIDAICGSETELQRLVANSVSVN